MSYFRGISHGSLVSTLHRNILNLVDQFVRHMNTIDFDFDKFCYLLDILTEHNIKDNINTLCINYVDARVISGKQIVNTEVFDTETEIITHSKINTLIDHLGTNYKISKKTLFRMRTNVVINMYKHLLLQSPNSTPFLCNNSNSLLFQMNKFWNNTKMDEIVMSLPSTMNKIMQEIQYLAFVTSCKQSTQAKYEAFVVDKLELENNIKSYITRS
jgi:hypothetical protein